MTNSSFVQSNNTQAAVLPVSTAQTGAATSTAQTPFFGYPGMGGSGTWAASTPGPAPNAPSGSWPPTNIQATKPLNFTWGEQAPWTTSAATGGGGGGGGGTSNLSQPSRLNTSIPSMNAMGSLPSSSATGPNQGPGTTVVPNWMNFEDLPPTLRMQLQEMERLCQQMERFAERGIPEENDRVSFRLQKHLDELSGQTMTLQTALAMSSADVADLKRTKDGGIRCMQYVCSLQEALHIALADKGPSDHDTGLCVKTERWTVAQPSSSLSWTWSSNPNELPTPIFQTLRLPSVFMEAVTAALEQRASLCREKLNQIAHLLSMNAERSTEISSLQRHETDARNAFDQSRSGDPDSQLARRDTIQRAQNVLHNEHTLLIQLAGSVAMLHERLQALRDWFTLLYQQRRPQAPNPLQQPQRTQPAWGFSSSTT
ncbi:hypothetical protein F1559_002475 [Cyanidiococcus yangmingshanensis]|uniref:Uncharacterized protein n=1 Tax=Cyanidiococcus yangmingshanensis TaxID=2690220 RepID=A0A7J7IEH9_9RHOD|nr:hypothetical protein F1559_002475 [Cyanidiococcus yangmingshanensis]